MCGTSWSARWRGGGEASPLSPGFPRENVGFITLFPGKKVEKITIFPGKIVEIITKFLASDGFY
jgi:hypothetical protein